MRLLSDRELVVASHNLGKVREIKALLAPHNVRVSSAAKFNLAEPNETGTSFSANAKIKATAGTRESKHLVGVYWGVGGLF